MSKHGIDISEHNGNVNMQAIKNEGVEFVMIRASWGHFAEDAQVRNNVVKCQQAGMPYGFYHYSYASNDSEAYAEANSFLALCNELGGATYPLNLDMEDADGWKARNGVSDAMNIRTIQIFKEVIEGAGKYLSLYMSKSWFDRLRAINADLVDSIDAWLAHWGIPEPSMACGMWQYSSDGSINGSSLRTDVNYCYLDYPSIIAGMNGDNPAQPEPAPAPSPAPSEDVNEGDSVRIKVSATNYVTGESIPSWVKGSSYNILQKGAGKVLLEGIYSWVRIEDIEGQPEASGNGLFLGCEVRVQNGSQDYSGGGLASFVYDTVYTIIDINGDRVVIGIDGAVTAALHASNLYKA